MCLGGISLGRGCKQHTLVSRSACAQSRAWERAPHKSIARRLSVVGQAQRREVLLGCTAGTASAAAVSARPAASLAAGDPATASRLPLVPKRPLIDELQVSEVIKGNWQLSGGHSGDSADDRTRGSAAVADMAAFAAAGVTTFDTADIYGPSESLIGEFIRRRGGSADLQLLTKSCKFGSDMTNVSQKAVSQGITRSLQRLSVPAVDLVQFYWHDYGVRNYVAAAQYLMEDVAAGRVRHLGVTNMDVPRMQQLMDGGVVIAANQVQYSLLDRRPDNEMQAFCKANDIKLLPFGTVAGGFLSDKYLGVPASSVKADTYSKSKYASVLGQVGGWSWFQALLTELDGVAKKHETSISNVACRWVLDRPAVAGIIVGARNAKHVRDHQELTTVRLDAEDNARLQDVLAKGRQSRGDVYSWERGGVW